MRRIVCAVIIILFLGPGFAEAAKLKKKETSDIGTTYWCSFKNSPFPAKGHKYTDDTVAIFVPRHFCATQIRAKIKVKRRGKWRRRHKTLCYSKELEEKYKSQNIKYRILRRTPMDYVVHFHGHSNTIRKTFRNHRIREQFAASLQNAILVVPQGPVNSVDSAAGKLERPGGFKKLMYEAHAFLRKKGLRNHKQRIGSIILTSHSGGYLATAQVIKHGGLQIREIFLFDSLYAYKDTFLNWLLEDRTRKLINVYYRKKPTARTEEFMAMSRAAGLHYVSITENDLKRKRFKRKQLYRERVIHIRTQLGHSLCTNKYYGYRDYLYASCLKRYHSSDWFKRNGLDRYQR